MDAIAALLSRRSIRKYTNQPVSDEDVADILTAAMNAPSAGNQQPWQFIVIRERQTLDAIPKFHPYSRMLHEASVAIVVCGDLSREQSKGFWVQDCSAATQNALIAAHAKGLGAVWLGVYPREERVEGCRKLLGLPDDVVPLCIIPIGYPAERKGPANRYDPSRVHFERW